MSLHSTSSKVRPLLEPRLEEEEEEEEEGNQSWWKRVLNGGEDSKSRIFFTLTLPMILTNASYYFINLVSVMFAGHLGEVEFAASNLANSWSFVTGLIFMAGLSGALETLCGQGYGAKLYGLLGMYLQASCIISFLFSIIISVLWFFSEPILIFLHQDPHISEKSALYVRYLIPGLFAYGFLQNVLRFLQTQSVVKPLVICSVFPLIIHIPITHVLVHWSGLGFRGAALAVSLSLWISTFMLVLYLLCSKDFGHTWDGFSLESLWYLLPNLKLALPSAAMVCLEEWAFELLVILAGLMPNSEITTSLIAMCVNTQTIAYMITFGLSATVSTRVSNELGAGNMNRAKVAMAMSLKVSILLALAFVMALAFGHDLWAGFFTDSTVIKKQFASMFPLLAVSIIFDSVQGVLSGVARGCGWQHSAVCINLLTFYFVGMPVASLLAFKLKLYTKGLWMGLICGLTLQTVSLLLLTQCRKWTRLDLSQNGVDKQDLVLV